MSVSFASSSASGASLSQALPHIVSRPRSTRQLYHLLFESIPIDSPHLPWLLYLTSNYFGPAPLSWLPKPKGWPSSQVTDKNVQSLVVEKAELVAADLERRQDGCKKDRSLLDQGFWYAVDYLEVLETIKGSKPRIEWLKEKNVVLCGRPPQGFDHVIDPQTGRKGFLYKAQADKTPAQSLDPVWDSLCFLDCAMTVQLLFYEVFLEIFGEVQFNDLFFSLQFQSSQSILPAFVGLLNRLDVGEQSSVIRSVLQVGDRVFFRNRDSYQKKHLWGYWGGFNMICKELSPPRFIGFGASSKGLLEEEVLELFQKAYNDPPTSLVQWSSGDLSNQIRNAEDAALANYTAPRKEEPLGLSRVVRISVPMIRDLVLAREQDQIL